MDETLTKEQALWAVKRLWSIANARGWNQTALEHESGVGQSTISRMLSTEQASVETLKKVSRTLGLRLSDILHEVDRVAEPIQGYMATPLTGLSHRADAEVRRVVDVVRRVARSETFLPPAFDVYWPGDRTHPKDHPDLPARQVYMTDRSRASTYDYLVVFCGAPSYGVGQETEIATQAGVPAVRLIPPRVSRMMQGAFINAFDVTYAGSLETEIVLDEDKILGGFKWIRENYFRQHALCRGTNRDTFGDRLTTLLADRCNGMTNEQFANDVGISLDYLHTLMKEPFAVANPSAILLKRMAIRLGEHVGYLLGEAEEIDPIWTESNAAWRSWIDKTPGLDAATALRIRDQWRDEYVRERRDESSVGSQRKRSLRMREPDWDARYRRDARRMAQGASHDLFS